MKFFYPGTTWKKRVVHIMVLFTIGINLFLDDLQDTLFEVGEDMIALANDLSIPAENAAEAVEKNVMPLLEYAQSTSFGEQITERFDLPTTDDFYVELTRIKDFRHSLKEYSTYLTLTGLIIRIVSYLFWLSVIIALLWLGIDLIKCGSKTVRVLVMTSLILAVPFNILIYKILTKLFLFGQTDFTKILPMLQ